MGAGAWGGAESPASHEAGYALDEAICAVLTSGESRLSRGGLRSVELTAVGNRRSVRAYTTQPARYFSRVSHLLLPPLANLLRSGFHFAFAP